MQYSFKCLIALVLVSCLNSCHLDSYKSKGSPKLTEIWIAEKVVVSDNSWTFIYDNERDWEGISRDDYSVCTPYAIAFFDNGQYEEFRNARFLREYLEDPGFQDNPYLSPTLRSLDRYKMDDQFFYSTSYGARADKPENYRAVCQILSQDNVRIVLKLLDPSGNRFPINAEQINYQYIATYKRVRYSDIPDYSSSGKDNTVVSIILPPANEIWYESHSGKTIPLAKESSLLVSNTYVNGKGVYRFSKDLTDIDGLFDYSKQCSTTKENEDFKSLVLPKKISRIGQFGISHLNHATKLVLPYDLSSMGSDCLCRFGEKTPDTSNIYFIGEKAPSFVSTSIWNMHDLVSEGKKIDNFYYPENNESYSSLLTIKVQGTATHNWVPVKYRISFSN